MSMLIQMPTEQHFVVLLPLWQPSKYCAGAQANQYADECECRRESHDRWSSFQKLRGILVALCLIVTKKKGKTSVFGLIAMKRFTYSNCTGNITQELAEQFELSGLLNTTSNLWMIKLHLY
ncbi:uncharacterized protein LOC141623933 isoform X3 [Silene latifolia]|uniref:uncharacterized protein LOC141623933 isoform X3 n=1 Tax=Silene latifolia TaxID=37657 RepID=UPI003D776E52